MAQNVASSDEVTEDDIDAYKMPTTLRLCKRLGIQLNEKPTLDQMKLLLKMKLLCRESGREEELSKMHTDYERNESWRTDMRILYEKIGDTTKNVMRMNDPVVKDLRQTFPNIEKVLQDESEMLKESKAPILVLGETGAGKSSFINLLLGEDLLPSSLLSNTHVVCEIQHSETYSARLFPISGEEKVLEYDGNKQEFRSQLGEEIQRLEDGKGVYKKAEIFLPSEFLKSGVTLVDSPGIGENKEMENVVLDYILNACTFIYVIATDSAGGMQQRMQKLLAKVYSKALKEQRVYQPERALFICNKWDQAPPLERAEIRKDTVRKIMDYWPDCKETQIFTFSTKEAADMLKIESNKLHPKCQLIMKAINELIPLGREIQILKSYRYLDNLVDRCCHLFGAYLNQTKMSREERLRKQRETQERLVILKGNVEIFFEQQDKALREDIVVLVDKLKQFLQEEDNMNAICTFSENDFAEEKDWKTLAVAIRAKLYERIRDVVKGWEEKRGEFKSIGDRISTSLEEEFPKFTAEIFQAQKNLSHSIEDRPVEKEHIMPKLIRRQFDGLGAGMRIAVGIGLAPVMFLGIAARLPLFGFRAFKKTISDKMMQFDFKRAIGHEDQTALFRRYAVGTVEKITDKLELKAVIETDIQPLFRYLHQQKAKIEGIINSDMELLKQMKEEERNERDIDKTYSPLKEKFMMLHYELENFLFTNMPEQYSKDYVQYPADLLGDWEDREPVCHGLEAEIFPTKLKDSLDKGSFKDVSIRITREEIKPTNIRKRKLIQQAYTYISKPFMVSWSGIIVQKNNHYQILEPLHCNLREWLPRCRGDHGAGSWRTFLQGVVDQIVKGLSFLHDKTLVHYDLSQDTIAVDSHGTVKLTNISVPRRLFIRVESGVNHKVQLSRYIYIPERFIFPKESSITLSSFTSSSDSTSTEGIRMYRFSSEKGSAPDGKMSESLVDGSDEYVYQSQLRENDSASAVNGMGSNTIVRLPGRENDDVIAFQQKPCNYSLKQAAVTKSLLQSDDIYRMKDDMFSLGMLMWEIWVGKPLYGEDDCRKVDENILRDTEKLRSFLNKFRPVKEPHFVSTPDSEDQVLSEWWTTISGCMHRKLTAADYLSRWEHFRNNYPGDSLIYITRSLLQSDDIYRMKDNMFSLGMLMWEIWVGKPLYGDEDCRKVDENILRDTEKLRSFLNKFRPVKEPHFVSTPDSEDQVLSEWWTTISGCMHRKLTAADFLSRWEHFRNSYPDVSLIYSQSHFSMSPGV